MTLGTEKRWSKEVALDYSFVALSIASSLIRFGTFGSFFYSGWNKITYHFKRAKRNKTQTTKRTRKKCVMTAVWCDNIGQLFTHSLFTLSVIIERNIKGEMNGRKNTRHSFVCFLHSLSFLIFTKELGQLFLCSQFTYHKIRFIFIFFSFKYLFWFCYHLKCVFVVVVVFVNTRVWNFHLNLKCIYSFCECLFII